MDTDNIQHKLEDLLKDEMKLTVIENDLLLNFLDKYKKIDLFDKIAGLIYGAAVADCLGLYFEGQTYDDMKEKYPKGVTDMISANSRGFEQGDWSDDTDQLILSMDTLTENKLQFNFKTFSNKLHNWKLHGFKELGDTAGTGIDGYTNNVLCQKTFLQKPFDAALNTYKTLGGNKATNSAAMRCGIMAIAKRSQNASIDQCAITHVDSRCIFSCWLITFICRSLLNGKKINLVELLKNKETFIKNKIHHSEFSEYQRTYTGDLGKLLEKLELGTNGNINYTLKALGCAIYALREIDEGKVSNCDDYKRIVLEIVNLGGDTDTNACIAGQVLGSSLGYRKLPMDWISKLKNKNWLDKKIIKLFNAMINL